jgi:two-component system OmpR family sensor kinase
MAVSARSLTDGGFQKIPLEGPREVQVLITTINEMGEQIEASQRSQRDFIANVSHDLKTPLTSIQGFAQAILDGTANDPTSLRKAAGVI